MFLFLYECGGMEITMLGAEEACIPGALPCCFAGTSPWRVGRHRRAYSFFVLQVIALAGRKEGRSSRFENVISAAGMGL